MLTLDFDGKVTSINPAACRLTGLAESAVLGRDIGAFAHPLLSVAGAIRPDQSQIIELSTARRYKVQKTEFIDRGFKRAFVLIEELTAEIGSAMLGAMIGLPPDHLEDHAAYCASWLNVIRDEPRAFFSAGAKAQAAIDWLIAKAGSPEKACLDLPGVPGLAAPATG